MVLLTAILFSSARHGTGRGHQRWIDSLRVYCKAGRGGNGLPTVGGIGGKGGDVIIECSIPKSKKKEALVNSLQDIFKKTFKGDSTNQKLLGGVGANSRKERIIGEAGADAILKVPPGLLLTDEATGRVLKDFNREGEKCVVAAGGQGGGPNSDWIGVVGQRKFVRLDLKLLADVGLVGFPNAGKSTFLKSISKARPKIASYPFTTIKPNLGHLVYSDGREITLADLPGLIEGASYNVGMGHRFLKHVERTRILLFIVDIGGFQLNAESTYRSAFETVVLLNRELELYNPDLIKKPALCVINKMDTDKDEDLYQKLLTQMKDFHNEDFLKNLPDDCRPTKFIDFHEIIPISAKFNSVSVQYVKNRLRTLIDAIEDEKLRKNEKMKELVVALNGSASGKNPMLI